MSLYLAARARSSAKLGGARAGQANRWTAVAENRTGTLEYDYRLIKSGTTYRTIGWKAESSWALTFTEPGESAAREASGYSVK